MKSIKKSMRVSRKKVIKPAKQKRKNCRYECDEKMSDEIFRTNKILATNKIHKMFQSG